MEESNVLNDLTIITVNYNTREYLRHCLSYVPASAEGLRYEMIVVDNGSSDGSGKMVRDEFPWVSLIVNDSNVGSTRAYNQAIRRTRSRHVVLLNSDTVPLPGALSTLVRFANSCSGEVAIIGPKILNPDDSVQVSISGFPTLTKQFFHANPWLRGIALRLLEWHPLRKLFSSSSSRNLQSFWDYDSLREVDYVTAACMLITRAAIDDVGLLDEDYFLYIEECDWAFRMRKKGYKVLFYPGCSIVHFGGASSGQKLGRKQIANRFLLEYLRSITLFYHKNYSTSQALFLRLINVEGFALQLLGALLLFPYHRIQGQGAQNSQAIRVYAMAIQIMLSVDVRGRR